MAHGDFDVLGCQGTDEGNGVWELGGEGDELDDILKIAGAVDRCRSCTAGGEE